MDPSIIKLLEEDEDETMHSGADVEALQAALNRDIESDTSSSQPFDSNTVLYQGSNQTGTQDQDGKTINLHGQQALQSVLQPEQNLLEREQEPYVSVLGSPQQQPNDVPRELNCVPIQQKQSQDGGKIAGQVFHTTGTQTSQKNATLTCESGSASQCLKSQKTDSRQMSGGKQVSLTVLMPVLLSQLDKDRAMQLSTLYDKMQRNEIMKDVFVRHMSSIVGNEKLKLATNKLLYSQASRQMSSNQFRLPSQSSAQQNNTRMSSFTAGGPQLSGPQSFTQLQKSSLDSPANASHATTPVVSMLIDSSYPSIENNAKNSQEMDPQPDSHIGVIGSQISSSSLRALNQERDRSSSPGQGLNKQQQQHLANYSVPDVYSLGSSLKSQPHDSHHQRVGSTSVGGSTQAMNMMSGAKFERQNSISDPTRLQGGSLSHVSRNPNPCQFSTSKELKSDHPLSSVAYRKKKSAGCDAEVQRKLHLSSPQGCSSAQPVQGNAIPAISEDMNSVSRSLSSRLDYNVPLSSQNPLVSSPAGVNARIPQKRPYDGQKKPLEDLGSSPPLPSKKQKVSGAISDQSIEQLNDVAAVGGVNLQEEEERLLSGRKDSRVSEASRRIMYEEERGILLKTPLEKKLAEIMAKHGLKKISNDVEQCLSLSVEERMRGLICNLIRFSKQRADAEKPMHLKLITSDVRQQIIRLNCKAKEEWEKRQIDLEKVQNFDESEGSRVDGDNQKNEGQVKSVKKNKEDDEKMGTAAANIAARAAVGGDDMLSKWQLMAEQARQKHERGLDAASSSQASNGRSRKEIQEAEKRGLLNLPASGSMRKFGRNQVIVARTIALKDVIAVLEREPQMSRSTLIHRLYERTRSMAVAK